MSGFDKMKLTYQDASTPGKEQARRRNNTAFYKEAEEKIILPWAIYDSALLGGPEVSSYQSTFAELVPKRYSDIREYIESSLEGKKGKAIGLDIGGTGSRLFAGFKTGFFQRTAGIALKDTRRQYRVSIEKDHARKHEVIEGDLLSPKTRRQMLDWLDGKKADVIFKRMEGGLELLPHDPRWFGVALRELYHVLSEQGLLFAQTVFQDSPEKIQLIESEKMRDWTQAIKMNYPNVLDVAWDGRSLRIQKLAHAPTELPSLSK